MKNVLFALDKAVLPAATVKRAEAGKLHIIYLPGKLYAMLKEPNVEAAEWEITRGFFVLHVVRENMEYPFDIIIGPLESSEAFLFESVSTIMFVDESKTNEFSLDGTRIVVKGLKLPKAAPGKYLTSLLGPNTEKMLDT